MSSNTPTTGTGASPVGEDHKKRPLWLWIVLAVVVIAAIILLLTRCGGGDDNAADAAGAGASAAASGASAAGSAGSSAGSSDAASGGATSGGSAGSTSTAGATGATGPAATPPAATPPTATVPPAGAGGSLTAGGTSLLPIATAGGAGGDLSQYVGQPAVATDVVVLSAPADNGFWVGTSDADRVYVHLLEQGLVSPHPVRAGDHVSFTGSVVATGPTLAADDGVDTTEGADQLEAQKAHLELAKSAVMFTS